MPVCPKCREKNPKLGAKCPRDGFYFIEEGALEEAAEDSRIGKLTADKFVIVDLISEGGMGAVYKAIQLPVEREVAVKVLRAELEDSDQGRDRFIREARAVSKLTHPNVITLHDFGFEQSGHPYMVMEYAPGVSLAGWLRRGDLTVSRIIHVLQQVLSALSDAHQRGIVHRDLKPENLIVTKTGNDQDYIKLLDFGIARLVNEGATRGLTREGEVFGTPHYMSPEQAQGSTDIGPPADVYAIGIIAYELFSGSPPFDASTPLSVLYMHINDDLPTLRPRAGLALPDAVLTVIRNATNKDPQERYQTAGEMLADLNQHLEQEGVANSLPYSAGASQSGQFPESSGPADVSRELLTQGETLTLDEPVDTSADEDEDESRDTSKPPPTWAHAPPTGDIDTQESLRDADKRKKRVILVAAALLIAVLVVGVTASLFFGDDSSASNAGVDKTESTESEEAPGPPDDAPTDDEAPPTVAEKGNGDDNDNAEGTVKNNSEPTDEAAKPVVEDDSPEEARVDKPADDEAGDTDEEETSRQAAKPSSGAKSKPRPASGESKSDDKEEQPEKFEPSKFRPAKDSDDKSDDDPEKFEPSKWR
ncbi:MAG: serine/threonine protein kinase [Myxococcota bacterium]